MKAVCSFFLLFITIGQSSQMYFHREDFPLTQWGMYRSFGHFHQIIKVNVVIDEIENPGNQGTNYWVFTRKIKEFFKNITGTDDFNVIVENRNIATVIQDLKPRISVLIADNFNIVKGQKLRLEILYWSELKTSNMNSPDYKIIVIDEIY